MDPERCERNSGDLPTSIESESHWGTSRTWNRAWHPLGNPWVFAEWRNEDIQSLDALRACSRTLRCELVWDTPKSAQNHKASPSTVCAKQRSPHLDLWRQRTKAQMLNQNCSSPQVPGEHLIEQEEYLNTKATQQSGHKLRLWNQVNLNSYPGSVTLVRWPQASHIISVSLFLIWK